MKVSRHLSVALAILCVAPGTVFAQASVELRMKALEEVVHALDQRVASLEAQLHDRRVSTNVAQDKTNWRKLRKDMPDADVERLLGSPSKVDVFGSFIIWHYGYPSGGRIHFDATSRKVTGWHEPATL